MRRTVFLPLLRYPVEIKANRKMSLADCFAAALAKQRKLDLYTGDPEFRAVEKEVKVVWI